MSDRNESKSLMGEECVTREDGAIDMIAFAREATIRDQMSTYAGSVKVVAPAKVNLLLNIGAKREDGYHDVDTIVHALMLHDVLYVRTRPLEEMLEGPSIGNAADTSDLPEVRIVAVGCGGVEPPMIPTEENIVYKAIRMFAQEVGMGRGECVEVRLEKHIPHQAGLGGGSSDAAAALVGLASLWGIPAGDLRIRACAERLGTDVAFFLDGGCARYSGTGSTLEERIKTDNSNVVLVKPPAGLSTAGVYREFDVSPEPVSEEAASQRPVSAKDVIRANNLGAPAYRLMPMLGALEEWLKEQSCVTDVLLCGSGSTMCAFCDNFQNAMRLSAVAQSQGYWTRATTLANLRAAVVPRK